MLTSRSAQLTVYSDGLYYAELLTDRIQRIVAGCAVRSGCAHLILQHTTGAMMLVEHEAGIMIDLKSILNTLVPQDRTYRHHLRGVDANGAGHVLSALLNTTLSIPVADGALLLGTYQEIMFIDFQAERAQRTVALTVLGERAR